MVWGGTPQAVRDLIIRSKIGSKLVEQLSPKDVRVDIGWLQTVGVKAETYWPTRGLPYNPKEDKPIVTPSLEEIIEMLTAGTGRTLRFVAGWTDDRCITSGRSRSKHWPFKIPLEIYGRTHDLLREWLQNPKLLPRRGDSPAGVPGDIADYNERMVAEAIKQARYNGFYAAALIHELQHALDLYQTSVTTEASGWEAERTFWKESR